MNKQAQANALQNFAASLGLTVVEKYQQDKRKTVPMWFLTKGGVSVSPVMNYDNLNSFMLGWKIGKDE